MNAATRYTCHDDAIRVASWSMRKRTSWLSDKETYQIEHRCRNFRQAGLLPRSSFILLPPSTPLAIAVAVDTVILIVTITVGLITVALTCTASVLRYLLAIPRVSLLFVTSQTIATFSFSSPSILQAINATCTRRRTEITWVYRKSENSTKTMTKTSTEIRGRIRDLRRRRERH